MSVLLLWALATSAYAQNMDELWGPSSAKPRDGDAARGKLFQHGKYAMFLQWGLYSQLATKVDGVTYYGIGERIMNSKMAGIPQTAES